MRNWSYGMSRFKALITQSRQAHCSRWYFLVAVRVRVAGGIQPVPRPLLTKSLALQQRFDGDFDAVSFKDIELLRCRRQADQIQAQVADKVMREFRR